MSFTPRFLSSFNIFYQNLAPSFSSIQIPNISRSPFFYQSCRAHPATLVSIWLIDFFVPVLSQTDTSQSLAYALSMGKIC
ncbi:MAG: hypothetical protein C5B47_08030 [Verrucomicrobia bacterium]|nr:MAG: hypothetical protein C5B47_08030 [Verrucomicrobiota bacterium]